MDWIARNANALVQGSVALAGAISMRGFRTLFCAHCEGSAGKSARQCSWWWVTLMPALLACIPISLQAQSATGKLSVTLTVVPSARMIFLPDGSTKVIVANGYESGSATKLYGQPESAANADQKPVADQKSTPANAAAGSQSAKQTRRRVKP